MSDVKRFAPFVWCTHITGLLSGEKKCEWQPWYRAHFTVNDRIRDEDHEAKLAGWTVDHDAMVQDRAKNLASQGWRVTIEDDNAFKMFGRERADGRKPVLAGKPDIVAIANGVVLVDDEKSGKPRDSDQWQVRLYQFALPRVWFKNQNVRISGQVGYRADDVVHVDPLSADQDAKIRTVMQLVTDSAMEPPRSPSAGECAFCDIAACPDRIREKQGSAEDVF